VDRRTLGGWLEGPGAGLPDADPQAYRGERLGLPREGAFSVASVGRRILALTIDWFAAVFITRLIAPRVEYGSDASALLVLATFGVVTALLVWLMGASIGHRLMGLQVVQLGAGGTSRVPLLASVVRTALLCLVVPAVIWDRDTRGLHDKAARTVVVKTS